MPNPLRLRPAPLDTRIFDGRRVFNLPPGALYHRGPQTVALKFDGPADDRLSLNRWIHQKADSADGTAEQPKPGQRSLTRYSVSENTKKGPQRPSRPAPAACLNHHRLTRRPVSLLAHRARSRSSSCRSRLRMRRQVPHLIGFRTDPSGSKNPFAEALPVNRAAAARASAAYWR
jgi:hypothetical protein